MIKESNWQFANQAGWRRYKDVGLDTEEILIALLSAGQKFGIQNVDIGTKFSGTSPTSLRDIFTVGAGTIYVRDTEIQVASLYEDMLNFECGHRLDVKARAKKKHLR